MAKYKILRPFHDIEKKLIYKAGEVVEFQKKRAEEINRKLPGAMEAETGKEEPEKGPEQETQDGKANLGTTENTAGSRPGRTDL